jgi:integrase
LSCVCASIFAQIGQKDSSGTRLADIIYAQYYNSNGKQVRVSTRTVVKQEALGTLRKLMGDRDNGLAPISEVRKIHYGHLRKALLDNYAARGNKSLRIRADGEETINGLKALDDFFGYKTAVNEQGQRYVEKSGVSITKITTDSAREFVRKRREEGTGNAAINRSLACLRRMLKLALQEKKIHDVPFVEFQKEPNARKGFLEMSKFELAQFPTALKPLITFLYYCGVRVGEALQIQWSQVNLEKRLNSAGRRADQDRRTSNCPAAVHAGHDA